MFSWDIKAHIALSSPRIWLIGVQLSIYNFCRYISVTQSMKPAYARAAERVVTEGLGGKLAAVDATAARDVASRFQIKGYPTLKYFKVGSALGVFCPMFSLLIFCLRFLTGSSSSRFLAYLLTFNFSSHWNNNNITSNNVNNNITRSNVNNNNNNNNNNKKMQHQQQQ